MTPDALRQTPEFQRLNTSAARIGADPKQIQGPGGNFSIKAGGTMLVKASGTWLADADTSDIFTAVDATGIKAAVQAGDPTADTPQQFQLGEGAKPSIETGFHAIFDDEVVLHTHCVATLARSTAPFVRAELDALKLSWVPYAKPGAALARAILQAQQPGTRGVILANHGVIVTGTTVAEAEAHLMKIATALETAPVPIASPDPEFEAALADTPWQALGPGATTALAFSPKQRELAIGPAIFPDQVIFLGSSPIKARRLPPEPQMTPPQPLVIVPDQGAAIPRNASPALRALAQMMGEVVFRLPGDPSRLTETEISELLGWDAEAYRQALEQARTERLFGKGSA